MQGQSLGGVIQELPIFISVFSCNKDMF